MGKKTLFGIFFLLFATIGHAVIIDGFHDGDFTANPAWEPHSASGVWSAASNKLVSPNADSNINTDLNLSNFTRLVFDFYGRVNTAGTASVYFNSPAKTPTGYNVALIGGLNLIRLRYDANVIISTATAVPNNDFNLSVVRSTDGNFNLFVNGVSVGSAFNSQAVLGNGFVVADYAASGAGTGTFDDFNYLQDSLVIDVNAPLDSTTYTSRYRPFQYRVYDENSLGCTSFNLDINNIVGVDNNLLVRHSAIGSAAIDANYYLLNLEGTHRAIFTGTCDLNSATQPLENLMVDANIFDFNNGLGLAFDNNSAWQRFGGTDLVRVVADSNADFVKAGSFALRMDINKTFSTGGFAGAIYTPTSTHWNLTDYNNDGYLSGWMCTNSMNSFTSFNSINHPGDYNFSVQLNTAGGVGTVRHKYAWNVVDDNLHNGCQLLSRKLDWVNAQSGALNWADVNRIDFYVETVINSDLNNFSVWLDDWKIVKGNPLSATLTKTFSLDLNAPRIYLFDNNINSGWDSNAEMDIRLGCTDVVSTTLNYFVARNGSTLLDVNIAKDTNRTVDTTVLNGVNDINAICTDGVGRQANSTASRTAYVNRFDLINENTGAAFDLALVSGLTGRSYDTNKVFDFKAAATTTRYFIGLTDDTIRFDINYSDNLTKIYREINQGIVDENILRVCVAPLQSFFVIDLLSSSEKAVQMYNWGSTCYSLADYTKFASGGNLALKAYAIVGSYYLYTVNPTTNAKTLLSLIDGSKVESVNLDLLEFNQRNFDFTFITEDVGFQKTGSRAIQIYYKNELTDNSSVDFNIFDGSTRVFTFHETANPNELTLNFDYSNLVLDANKLHLVVSSTKLDGTTESNDYYFSPQAITARGAIQNYFAIFLAFLIVLVGLTMLNVRMAYSWWGIFVVLIGVAVMGYAGGEWYIRLFQGIFVFIAIVLAVASKENQTLVN